MLKMTGIVKFITIYLMLMFSLTACNPLMMVIYQFSVGPWTSFCMPVFSKSSTGEILKNVQLTGTAKSNGHYVNTYNNISFNNTNIQTPSNVNTNYGKWNKIDQTDIAVGNAIMVNSIAGAVYLGNNQGVYFDDFTNAVFTGEYDYQTDTPRGVRAIVRNTGPVEVQYTYLDNNVTKLAPIVVDDASSDIVFTIISPNDRIYTSSSNLNLLTSSIVMPAIYDGSKLVDDGTSNQTNAAFLEYKIGDGPWKPVIGGSGNSSADQADKASTYTNPRTLTANNTGRVYLKFNKNPSSGYYVVYTKILSRKSHGDDRSVKLLITNQDPNATSISGGQSITPHQSIIAQSDGHIYLRVEGHSTTSMLGYGSLSVSLSTVATPQRFSSIIANFTNTIKSLAYQSAESVFKNFIASGMNTVIRSMLVLWMVWYVLGFVMGFKQIDQLTLVKKVVSIGLVATLISPNAWSFFNNMFFNAAINAIDDLIVRFDPNSIANPFAVFDDLAAMLFSGEIWWKLSYLVVGSPFIGIPLLFVFLYILYHFLKTYLRFVLSYCFSIIMICVFIALAPFCIPFILFDNQNLKQIFSQYCMLTIRLILEPFVMLIGIVIICNLITMQLSAILTSLNFCFKCVIPIRLDGLMTLITNIIPIKTDFTDYLLWEFSNTICIYGFLPWGIDGFSNNGLGILMVFFVQFIIPGIMTMIIAALLPAFMDFVSTLLNAITSIFIAGGAGLMGDSQSARGAFGAADFLFNTPFTLLSGGVSLIGRAVDFAEKMQKRDAMNKYFANNKDDKDDPDNQGGITGDGNNPRSLVQQPQPLDLTQQSQQNTRDQQLLSQTQEGRSLQNTLNSQETRHQELIEQLKQGGDKKTTLEKLENLHGERTKTIQDVKTKLESNFTQLNELDSQLTTRSEDLNKQINEISHRNPNDEKLTILKDEQNKVTAHLQNITAEKNIIDHHYELNDQKLKSLEQYSNSLTQLKTTDDPTEVTRHIENLENSHNQTKIPTDEVKTLDIRLNNDVHNNITQQLTTEHPSDIPVVPEHVQPEVRDNIQPDQVIQPENQIGGQPERAPIQPDIAPHIPAPEIPAHQPGAISAEHISQPIPEIPVHQPGTIGDNIPQPTEPQQPPSTQGEAGKVSGDDTLKEILEQQAEYQKQQEHVEKLQQAMEIAKGADTESLSTTEAPQGSNFTASQPQQPSAPESQQQMPETTTEPQTSTANTGAIHDDIHVEKSTEEDMALDAFKKQYGNDSSQIISTHENPQDQLKEYVEEYKRVYLEQHGNYEKLGENEQEINNKVERFLTDYWWKK